ncbi:MAG: hypothetical protein QOD93_7022 [Acetobacteraceae bacterium]|jgi:hypothetical protein|nr:hypothetical protein [Acetobacteraceae bacterium]
MTVCNKNPHLCLKKKTSCEIWVALEQTFEGCAHILPGALNKFCDSNIF